MSKEFGTETFSVLMDIDGEILKSSSKESEFLQGENFWNNLPAEYKSAVTKARVQMINRMNGCIEARIGKEKELLFIHR